MGLDKNGKTIQWDNDRPLPQMVLDNWTAACKRTKLDSHLTPYKKLYI